MSVNEISSPFPDEYGKYRLGTPINADIGEVYSDWPALDMEKLEGAKALIWNTNSTIKESIRVGGYTKESQDSWAFAADVKASLSFSPFMKVQTDIHMAESSNNARRTSGQTIMATAYYKSEVSIKCPTPDLLLKCATEDFVSKINNICTSMKLVKDVNEALKEANPANVDMIKLDTARLQKIVELKNELKDLNKKLEDALIEFYKRYGTGFISTLKVGAVGIYKGSVEYSSTSIQTRKNYGASISVGGQVGGIGAAVEFAKNQLRANSDAILEGEVFGMPAGSAPYQWADSMMQTFNNQHIKKMSEMEAWKPVMEKMNIPRPEIPSIERRDPNKDIPKFPGGDINSQIQNMKLREFRYAYVKKFKQEPNSDNYKQWIEDLKKTAQIDAKAIAAAGGSA
jgi:hypothetical protein